MADIKKIKIKELPQITSINDDDIFVESNTLETYKVTADDIAKYVSENEHLTGKYVPLNLKGVANGVAPLNSNKKIDGKYITYGTTSNTTYEGSSGKVLEQNLDNHLVDDDAHGYNTKINDEVTRATNAESDLNTKKAPLVSPTLTGTPKAPTASVGTNTTQIATTAFVQTAVSNHNTSTTTHSDIRDLITGLTNRLNALADSDDTTLDQLSEIVAYIKNNKSLIDSITTSKVNVSDIVNSLTSTAINKPLSANQGKVLKGLIDTLTANVSTHTDDTTVHITDTERANWNAAKTHADSAHAPSDAEINQNAFSNVKVGNATIAADSKTDIVELVAGENITFTPDSVNKKITVSSTGGSADPGDSVSFTQSLKTGTKIGTLTINGTDIDLYCQTNTDTTYDVAKQSANGLMSASDKIKLDYTNIAYCTCNTAAATAAKVATIDGNSKFVLQKGAIAIIKFTVTNTASKCTLNVGNTGAKSIWYNNAVYTGTSNQICGYVNRTHTYVYDGTYWVWVSAGVDVNTTYSNASLGQGYGTCTTAAATAAKVVTLSSYALAKGGIVAVKFTYAVPASATMNINSKGAKAIYYKGAKITTGIINAGDIATFMYDGSQYILIGIDSGVNGSNEVVSNTEPTNQSVGDYWLQEY